MRKAIIGSLQTFFNTLKEAQLLCKKMQVLLLSLLLSLLVQKYKY